MTIPEDWYIAQLFACTLRSNCTLLLRERNSSRMSTLGLTHLFDSASVVAEQTIQSHTLNNIAMHEYSPSTCRSIQRLPLPVYKPQ